MPDTLICYPGSIEKLKLLGATYLLLLFTYDEYITDPNTQFLLCLKAYVDKTAKNAGLTSYAGEPFLVSALHLKKHLKEHSSAWFVHAYLPDLESGSSAKK
jgi:hypothetical protein